MAVPEWPKASAARSRTHQTALGRVLQLFASKGAYILGSALSESLLLPVAAASKGQLKGVRHAHHGDFTLPA
jgi:hypothetical protein